MDDSDLTPLLPVDLQDKKKDKHHKSSLEEIGGPLISGPTGLGESTNSDQLQHHLLFTQAACA